MFSPSRRTHTQTCFCTSQNARARALCNCDAFVALYRSTLWCVVYFWDRCGKSSAIVITGESGAGKTEAMKLMLRYLTVVAPNIDGISKSANAIEQRLLDSSPITEAFGNAKTVRNDNSSRFGKFMELVLNDKGSIAGGNLRNYMLEKSRISDISAEERSYHIFYMLCAGSTAEEREFLSIPDPGATGQPAALAFNLLKNGRLEVPDKDDVKDMDELRQAATTCGFSAVTWRQMLCVVAAVLHLSNLSFSEGPNDTAMMDEDVGSIVARLLGVDSETLKYCLTHKVITPQGVQQPGGRKRSVTVKNLNAQQARVAAASLAQALYSSMFNFIISQINSAVVPPAGLSLSIGLLDIFGFEIFAVNKFEQLCINYTNEKLQNLFNHHMFELELQEYEMEEVDIAQISFQDNNKTVALFEMKKTGLFDMLDDEMVVPRATDLTYLERLTREMMGKHEAFDRGKSMHDGFVVKHYAHNVKYSVDGFIQKNSDLLTEDITSCLSSSASPFIVDLLSFGEEKGEGSGDRASVNLGGLDVGVAKAKRKTVGSAFKQQLVSLCERIGSMTTFYVRTFKTNTNKSSSEFDRSLMLMQLKCSGVMEVMKIRIAGFPTRIKFAEFVRRFWPLYPKARSMREVDGCIALLEASKLPADTFTLGKSKVFMKDRPFSQLSIIIKEIMDKHARELQRLLHRLMSQKRLAAAARQALARRAIIRVRQGFFVVAMYAKRFKVRNRWVAKITFDGEVAAKNAADRAARKREREAAQKARDEARQDRETKERLRQERLRSMVLHNEPYSRCDSIVLHQH
jgi:myosin heavy subunit